MSLKFPLKAPEILLSSNTTDRAYFAGILDGEGTLSIASARDKRDNTYRQYLAFQLGTCDLALLLWLQSRWGGTIYEHKANKRKNKKHREAFVLQWSPELVKNIARAVLPYLKLKKPQMDILVEWVDRTWSGKRGSQSHAALTPEKKHLREVLRARMQQYNRKGPRPVEMN